MTRLNFAHIARLAGLKYRSAYSYIKAERRPPYEKALRLEKATGVNILVWLKGDPAEIQAALESSPMVEAWAARMEAPDYGA